MAIVPVRVASWLPAASLPVTRQRYVAETALRPSPLTPFQAALIVAPSPESENSTVVPERISNVHCVDSEKRPLTTNSSRRPSPFGENRVALALKLVTSGAVRSGVGAGTGFSTGRRFTFSMSGMTLSPSPATPSLAIPSRVTVTGSSRDV